MKIGSFCGITVKNWYLWGKFLPLAMRHHHFYALISVLLLCLCPYHIHADTVRLGVGDGLSSHIVGGGVRGADGLLWFATWNGLDCYDGYEFHHVRVRPGDGASISTNHIRDIHLSDEGNIICHTDDDIFEFDLQSYTFRSIPSDRKSGLLDNVGKNWRGLSDGQGGFWTTDGNGLLKTVQSHHPASLLSGTGGEHPGAMMVDRAGNLWVSTRRDRGITVYAPGGVPVKRIPLATVPYCIYQTRRGDIWVGCKPGALFRLGDASICDVPVYDIKEDARGRLWIATFGEGVRCVPDPSAPSPELTGSFGGKKVRKLLITSSGNLVAATSEGLLVGHIADEDCHDTRLRRICRDSYNPASIASDALMGVAIDSRNNIYIGTESSGIDVIPEDSLFADNPAFSHYNSLNSSLPGDICRAMTFASDTLLMVVGNDNVTAFNPMTGESVNYNCNFWGDSCSFAEAPPVRLADGSWVFSAVQGAFMASRHNLYTRGYVPPLVFTTLAINGGRADFCLAPRREIALPPSGRNLAVGFAAIDHVDNRGILYRTSLDGSPWTGASPSRSVTLFGLSPGRHVLDVQSTDRYGRWVDNTRSIAITVAPFWYETWWATMSFGLLALGVCVAVVYTIVYVRRLNRQRRELLDKYMELIKTPGISGPEQHREPNHAVSLAYQFPDDSAFFERVSRYVEENIDNPKANVDDMAAAAAASRSTLNRRLRSRLGITAARLLVEARMRRAASLLRDGSMPVGDIAAMCGYTDTQYFQRVFRNHYGMSPLQYRQG